MKKGIIIIYLLSFFILFTACKNKNPLDNSKITEPPTAISPTETVTEPTPTIVPTIQVLSIEDYYPFQPDTNDIFTGKGNEYASYQTHIDYIDKDKNQMQIRTNNGGTETVQVIDRNNNELSIVLKKNECYYRDNFIEQDNFFETPEILLMEPLVTGTKWKLPNGNQRYISSTDAKVDTPLGNYKTLEVTTVEKDGVSKSYYAKGVGLIKQVFKSSDNDMEVTSTLSERKKKRSFCPNG